MIKKIINTLLLTLVLSLCVGVMPNYIYAENIIENLNILNQLSENTNNLPSCSIDTLINKFNEFPLNDYPYTYVTHSVKVYQDNNQNGIIDDDDPQVESGNFVENGTYILTLDLESIPDFKFSENYYTNPAPVSIERVNDNHIIITYVLGKLKSIEEVNLANLSITEFDSFIELFESLQISNMENYISLNSSVYGEPNFITYYRDNPDDSFESFMPYLGYDEQTQTTILNTEILENSDNEFAIIGWSHSEKGSFSSDTNNDYNGTLNMSPQPLSAKVGCYPDSGLYNQTMFIGHNSEIIDGQELETDGLYDCDLILEFLVEKNDNGKFVFVKSADVIDEIDLSNVIPDDFSAYGNTDFLIEYIKSRDFGDLKLYEETYGNCIYCYKMVDNEYEKINNENFSTNNQYALEILLKTPNGEAFKNEYDELKGSYIYTGSFSPEIEDSEFIVGSVEYVEQLDEYNIVSDQNASCISIFIPFTIEPIFVIVNDWSDIESKLTELLEQVSSVPVEFKLNQDITAEEGDSTFMIYDFMDVTVDLNGHIINRNLINADGTEKDRPYKTSVEIGDYLDCYGSVFHVERGKLTIKDSNPTLSHKGYIDATGLWHPNTGSGESKTIKGGIITGGIGWLDPSVSEEFDGGYGGGIFVGYYGAKVTLNGGTICGNAVKGYGGGIATYYIDFSSDVVLETRSKIEMNGSSICYNTSTESSGGIHLGQGVLEMNNGHIDNNSTKGSGGALSGSEAMVIIKSGTLNNNVASSFGAVFFHETFPDPDYKYFSLTADEGKTIEITGNISKIEGSAVMIDGILNLSGAIIIKDNIALPQVYDMNTYFQIMPDQETGKYPELSADGKTIKLFHNYINDLLINHRGETELNIVGPLTGSYINVATYIYLDPDDSDDEITLIDDYSLANPNTKATEYFHYVASSMYNLCLKDGKLCLTKAAVVDDIKTSDGLTSALAQAETLLSEDPESNIKIEISENITFEADDSSDDGFAIPPNAELDLNGKEVYVNGKITIFGKLEDSTGDGKIYLENPGDLIYDTQTDANFDGETSQEPVWTDDVKGDLKGYYCMYQVGANTKWAKTNEGKEWKQPGDDEAKFKIQPTAYNSLLENLSDYTDVYKADTKIKVGMRLNLTKINSNTPTYFDFAFTDTTLKEWSSGDTSLKCMTFSISGLKTYKDINGQAAIYSKPNKNIINSQFFSKDKSAGSSE